MENKQCGEVCQLTCNDCEVCIHVYSCTCLDFLINYTMCKHIHLVATNNKCNTEVQTKCTRSEYKHKPLYVKKHPTIRLVSQQDQTITSIKNRLYQKLSALLLLVRQSSNTALLLSAEDHVNSASSLLKLTQSNTVAQNIKISRSPANKHLTTQRPFYTTKKKRKKQERCLVKPTVDDKKEVATFLLHDKSLYSKEATEAKDTITRGKQCTSWLVCYVKQHRHIRS